LRCEDGRSVTADDIRGIADWLKHHRSDREIAFRPARVLMQDFTGVPAVVDLAAMRDAMQGLGGNPDRINPLVPVDLVIDHSVIVDDFGNPRAFSRNVELEYERNGERYRFLRWGQSAFRNFRVVPPDTGIVHQVNLEYIATVVTEKDGVLYPDTLVGSLTFNYDT
jgi:aconitate hydratase